MNLLYALESVRTPFWDAVFSAVTHLGEETVFMVAAILIFWCVSKQEGYYLLLMGFFGTVVNQFLKLLFRIPRPWVRDPDFTIVESARAQATGYSFPSGHTQNAVATFGGIARSTRRPWVRWACVAVLLLVSFSRLYLGVHTLIDGELLRGDNQVGGNLWCMPNNRHEGMIAEESVSIRAIQRIYASLSGDRSPLTPKDIFDIAEGTREGDAEAAKAAFAELGEVAGYTIAAAVTLIDGLVVIGGGLSGASKYILPALMNELRAETGTFAGARFNRLIAKPYNLEDPAESAAFLENSSKMVTVPGTDRTVEYHTDSRIGVAVSRLGASRAIALGAYWFAVSELKKKGLL